MSTMRYDMIIVGGGLVGAGLAVALKQTDLRVAVIDARLPSSDDPRLFALNVSSCQFLENLGFWKTLEPHATPIHQVQVSHRGHFGTVRMHHDEVNLPTLGHVVPAKYIEAAIQAELATLPNVDLYCPARLSALHQLEDGAEVILETDKGEVTLQASIVIGADGASSTVRKLVDIPVDVVDYDQSAMVTRVRLPRSHQHIAYERFYQHGAIAMLPLPDQESACIVTAEKSEIARLSALTDEAYLAEIQKLIGSRLGRLQGITKRYEFPLKMVRAARTLDGAVLLLGNAAHTLHPIAAQGFNLALYEAAVLVEGISTKRHGGHPVSAADLHDMLLQSRQQLTVSVNVSHWLTRIFSSNSLPANLLLSLGMAGFNATTPIKTKFMKMMTGRSGRVPTLLMRQHEQ